MGHRQLGGRRGRLRGRRAGREGRRGPRPPARACATSSSRTPPATWPTRVSLDELRERGRASRRGRARRPHRRGRPRRPLHVHLHLGHHRAAQGLRAHARQLPLGARHGPAARAAQRRRRPRLPLPAAGPRLRAAHPARRVRHGRDDRLLGRRHEADHPRADGGQADLPALGPAHLREALHAGLGPAPGRGDQGHPRGRRPRSATCEVRGEEVPADLQEQWAPLAAQGRLRAQPLRRPAARGGHRRRADRARDPRVLLGLRRSRSSRATG